jgi:Ca-activated chloride channel family protein
MTDFGFLAPVRLALLAVPLLLGAAYLVVQTRRRRYALRFTTVEMLDEVAPDRSGWRRHATAAVLLVAVLTAALAFARPVIAGEAEEAQQIVILAIDTSLSMQADDVTPNRAAAARDAAGVFLDTVPDGVAVGIVTFDGRARLAISPTTRLDAVRRTIENEPSLGEGTAIGEAVFLGLDAIDDAIARSENEGDVGAAPVGTIVLLSDGDTTQGRPNDEAASEARDRNITVHTIAFGTENGTIEDPMGGRIAVPVNRQALEQLAYQTEGRALSAVTADELSRVYQDLGESVQVEVVRVEVTDWFAGAALVALIVSATASLAWAGRLP